jgi:rhodanese-related sulfurtransferase
LSDVIYYLLICRSVTYAQRAARALERAGITAIVSRVPQAVAIDGCAYCVKVSGYNISGALVAIKQAGLYPVRVFARYADGNLSEVGL